jgi:hypothetical protein
MVSVVNQPVEHAVSQGGTADLFVPREPGKCEVRIQ